MAAQGHSMGIQLQYVKAFGQPSSSADSQQTHDSPRAGASAAGLHNGSPDGLCTKFGVGQMGGHSARLQHGGAHQQASQPPSGARAFTALSSATPAVAASASALRYGPEDPVAAKEVLKRLTSHMSPSELTELQNIIREQRLQRQQQDTIALIAAGAPAGPSFSLPAGTCTTPALPSLHPSHFAGLVQQSLYPLDAMRVVGAAVALSAAARQQQSCSQVPAHHSNYLPDIASQQLMVRQQCRPQQHPFSPVMSAATAAAASQAAPAASSLRHPGVASCRAPRSSRSRTPRTTAICTLPWSSPTNNQQLQPVLAAVAAAVPATAASSLAQVALPPSPSPPPAAAAAGDCPSMTDNPSCSLQARFSRLSADVQVSVLSQLDDLEASEVERRAAKDARRTARETAAGNAQRKSTRTRKVKMFEDEDQLLPINNSRSVSPDPAAAAAERAGSTDANSSTAIEIPTLLPQQQQQQQQQQQEVVKKRVRFAFADDDGGAESDDHAAGKKSRSSNSSSASPQIQGSGGVSQCDVLCALDGLTVFRLEAEGPEGEYDQSAVRRIVRRVGTRAQARKRMHKKTIRRRRPQRAPLC